MNFLFLCFDAWIQVKGKVNYKFEYVLSSLVTRIIQCPPSTAVSDISLIVSDGHLWSDSHDSYYSSGRNYNTSSVTDMLNTLNWPTLQQRRLKTRLITFYKIVHHIVPVPSDLLIPTDNRTRQFHPQTYRHILTF